MKDDIEPLSQTEKINCRRITIQSGKTTGEAPEDGLLIIYLSGTGSVTSSPNMFNCNIAPGVILLIAPRISFIERMNTESEALVISAPAITEFLERKDKPICSVSDDAQKSLASLAAVLEKYGSAASDGIRMLINLLEQLYSRTKSENEEDAVRILLERIEKEFGNSSFDLSKAVEDIGYSEDYFRRLFKSKTGYTPSMKLTNVRLEHALQLLQQSETKPKIAEIANQCGFESCQYFCRVFKRHMKMTPGSYYEMQWMSRSRVIYTQRAVNDVYTQNRNAGLMIPKLKPLKRQLEFLDWEFGIYFHFGLRTFYPETKDWDPNWMSPERFNPQQLDCEAWIRDVVRIGARYAVLVVTHHDGFNLWDSACSDYTVAKSPWKDGKGDVVREFVEACRKYNIHVGLSYSPTNAMRMKFSSRAAYNNFIAQQLRELLTNYGKIDYLSLNGCGTGENDFDEYEMSKMIRSLQPNILLYNLWDPDTRWIGSDFGIAPLPHFNTVKETKKITGTSGEAYSDIYRFLPAECDLRVRKKWFSVDGSEALLYTADDLMGIYEMSVGRGCNLLINIGPDKRGLLPEADVNLLVSLGDRIREYEKKKIPYFGALYKTDDNHYVIHSDHPVSVNRVVLEENIEEGEAIESFRIRSDKTIVYTGYNIGHKCICGFPTVITQSLTVEILSANGDFKLKSIIAYNIV